MYSFELEVMFVAILLTIIGCLVSYCIMYAQSPAELANFKHWGALASSFAISGALVHVFCETTGLNGWYCKHGVACSK